jgi:hypothetical protein
VAEVKNSLRVSRGFSDSASEHVPKRTQLIQGFCFGLASDLQSRFTSASASSAVGYESLPIFVIPFSLAVGSMSTTRHVSSEERTIHQFAKAGVTAKNPEIIATPSSENPLCVRLLILRTRCLKTAFASF